MNTPTPDPTAPQADTCGALSPRLTCDLPLHPEDPRAHSWAASAANVQGGANRNTIPEALTPPSVMTGRRPDGGSWDAVRMQDGTLVDRAADCTTHTEQSEGAPPGRADESTAQTHADADIRWQVQEVYAVGYGNSTGNNAREHHLAGLDAIADWLITDRRSHP